MKQTQGELQNLGQAPLLLSHYRSGQCLFHAPVVVGHRVLPGGCGISSSCVDRAADLSHRGSEAVRPVSCRPWRGGGTGLPSFSRAVGMRLVVGDPTEGAAHLGRPSYLSYGSCSLCWWQLDSPRCPASLLFPSLERWASHPAASPAPARSLAGPSS